MSQPSALVAGATGLVGRHILDRLLVTQHFGKIVLLVRRKLPVDDPRVEQVIVENFDLLHQYENIFNVNHIFCCLGTNLRNPGSKKLFRKVNLDYPLKMALLAQNKASFECFHVVTSVGASKNAILYYNTVKGQLEIALQRRKLKSLKIYRPSLLSGKRNKTSIREEITKKLVLLLSFLIIKRQQLGPAIIEAKTVAEAMLYAAELNEPGLEIFKPSDMMILADKHKSPRA